MLEAGSIGSDHLRTCERVQSFRVQGAGFRVQGPGHRVQGSGFRFQGSWFMVSTLDLCLGGQRSLRAASRENEDSKEGACTT